jgi:hypothetical protein
MYTTPLCGETCTGRYVVNNNGQFFASEDEYIKSATSTDDVIERLEIKQAITSGKDVEVSYSGGSLSQEVKSSSEMYFNYLVGPRNPGQLKHIKSIAPNKVTITFQFLVSIKYSGMISDRYFTISKKVELLQSKNYKSTGKIKLADIATGVSGTALFFQVNATISDIKVKSYISKVDKE